MYILLHILLSCHHGALAHLKAHLRGAVVHEASKCGIHVAVALPLALALWASAIPIASSLLLL